MKYITIATYNIRHGLDASMDWTRLAKIIHASGADIVGIQEVDMHTNRSGQVDTIDGLIRATGFPYTLFVPAMDYDGGQYGTAILSRFPFTASEYHPLYAADEEPRAFGCVTTSLGEQDSLCFLNTHLSYENPRLQDIQFHQIADWIDKHIDRSIPTILTGDFNTEDFAAFSPLTDRGFALVNNADHTYKTFRNPPVAIDNIVYRTALIPVAHGMIDSDYSDHNLLWCRFAFVD